jgi:hypothetical protein
MGNPPNVDPEELARGELREETGLIAASMIHLGSTWIAYGFLRQKPHICPATELTRANTDADPEEHYLVRRAVSIAKFAEMILDGQLLDVIGGATRHFKGAEIPPPRMSILRIQSSPRRPARPRRCIMEVTSWRELAWQRTSVLPLGCAGRLSCRGRTASSFVP